MKSGDAKRIATKLKKVQDFVKRSVDKDGNLTKGQAKAVARKLRAVADAVVQINDKTKARIGNGKGKQVAILADAKILERDLIKVMVGFEELATRTKKKVKSKEQVQNVGVDFNKVK